MDWKCRQHPNMCWWFLLTKVPKWIWVLSWHPWRRVQEREESRSQLYHLPPQTWSWGGGVGTELPPADCCTGPNSWLTKILLLLHPHRCSGSAQTGHSPRWLSLLTVFVPGGEKQGLSALLVLVISCSQKCKTDQVSSLCDPCEMSLPALFLFYRNSWSCINPLAKLLLLPTELMCSFIIRVL